MSVSYEWVGVKLPRCGPSATCARPCAREVDIAYTTVQTMMNVVEGKGHLTKSLGPKAQLYAPTVIRAMGVKEFAAKVKMAGPNVLRAINPRHNPTQDTMNRVRRAARRANVKPGCTSSAPFCSHLAMRGAPARAIQELAGTRT